MAAKLTTAEKTQLAEFRAAGFPVEALVAVGAGANVQLGSVVASNAAITTVLTYDVVMGRVVTRSWATRGVKFARNAR